MNAVTLAEDTDMENETETQGSNQTSAVNTEDVDANQEVKNQKINSVIVITGGSIVLAAAIWFVSKKYLLKK